MHEQGMAQKQQSKHTPTPFNGVMISSTFNDLQVHRAELMAALHKQQLHAVSMENYALQPDDDIITSSLNMVQQSSAYIGIISHRYGQILPHPEHNPDHVSVTQLEFEAAIKLGIPTLMFIMGDDHPVKASEVERDPDKIQKLIAFREHVKAGGRLIQVFESQEEFAKEAIHACANLAKHLNGQEKPQQQAEASSPNQLPLLNTYLQALRRECQVLPLAQLGGKAKHGKVVALEDVYIGISTRTPEKQRQHPDKEEETRFLTALEVAACDAHLVLLGGPGSGKSTFVKQLVASYVDELMEDAQSLVPLFIILRDLAPRLGQALDTLNDLSAEKRRRELAKLVFEQVKHDLTLLDVTDAAPALHKAFLSGEVFLVLDGLDEVPYDLREIVREAVDAVLHCHAMQRVIVTCRIRSYTEESRIEGFQVHTLAPFKEDQIDAFINGWYDAQVRLGALQTADANRLTGDLQSAVKTDQLKPLAENPMLMTAMIMVHQEETELPRERVVLYDKAVDILLRKWQQGKGKDAIPEDLDELFKSQERIRPIIERLAYKAHHKSARDTASDLPRPEAIAILEQPAYLGDLGFAGRFLDYVDERSGLLVGRGGAPGRPAAYSFPHRTFQEYLAGCYLINRRSAVRDIRKLAREGDFWSVAVQLGAQELLFNRRNPNQLLDNADQLLPEVSNEVTAREALWSAHMANVAGREAVELDEQETGTGYLDRARKALVSVLTSALPPIERAEAGSLLGQLGDPRKELLTLEAMPFCHVPAGPFLMGDDGHRNDHPVVLLDQPVPGNTGAIPVLRGGWTVTTKKTGGQMPAGISSSKEG